MITRARNVCIDCARFNYGFRYETRLNH
jgi:hypothetical protein